MNPRLGYPLRRRLEADHRPHLAVIRHTEREDSASEWRSRLEQVCWQYDPALSQNGILQATSVAADLASKSQTTFDVVVTSPYFRCVQTAVELCKQMGSETSLLLDRSLSEIYGREVMGDEQPLSPESVLRPLDDVRRYCSENGVKVRTQVLGSWPRWGEHKGSARSRFAQRFLQYLNRSQRSGLSFALVTHGDGVAAMLSTMPAMKGKEIRKVDFGGYFLARSSVAVPSPSGLTRVESNASLQSEDEPLSPTQSDLLPVSDQRVEEAWTVSYSCVKVGASVEESLTNRIARWSRKLGYAEEKVTKLLLYRPWASSEEGHARAEHNSAHNFGGAHAARDDDASSDGASSDGASTIAFYQANSPSKFYQRCGVSPANSPGKIYGSSMMTPPKPYVDAGVSPVHSPVKAYPPPEAAQAAGTKISL
eukprot:TRINITY_DN77311_c0_g1_i1.p1 TRINITY_DN77311_c0_g1~~TRINITY_DN77311_c0_g1_i1.p1  ORF type:complete len:423 (-),score=57.94 TRINITY_DN77311_c0_g1_i1:286-1554(-)